jgi:hypothetical protein
MAAIGASHSSHQSLASIMTRTAGDDGRPAGGAVRISGAKTPRKVQWAVDEGAPPHALDEHGLDVS